jgi:hypothetical protein
MTGDTECEGVRWSFNTGTNQREYNVREKELRPECIKIHHFKESERARPRTNALAKRMN